MKTPNTTSDLRKTPESQSLAVKYRPRTLSKLVGQESVVAQVQGMLRLNRFPSTILLVGETGSGKTTTGRLIASHILCQNLTKELTPCGECSSCEYKKGHPDLHELNMANSRGIDDIRALVSSANSMPTLGRKRIFLLDECHSLTPQAFQALLVPLEEPPAHTMWLMATTDPQKMPAAILGRADKLYIRPIKEEALVSRLKYIAKKESPKLFELKNSDKLFSEIAHLSNGRMRDSIATLSSVIFAFSSGRDYTVQDLIKEIARTPDADLDALAVSLLIALLNTNVKAATKAIFDASNARGLMTKTRWLVHAAVQSAVGKQFWRTTAMKDFSKRVSSENVSVSLSRLLLVQDLLCSVEMQMNSISIDDLVLLSSKVGAFLVSQKQLAGKEHA